MVLSFPFNTNRPWMLPRNAVVCLVYCPAKSELLILTIHDRQWGRSVFAVRYKIKFKKLFYRYSQNLYVWNPRHAFRTTNSNFRISADETAGQLTVHLRQCHRSLYKCGCFVQLFEYFIAFFSYYFIKLSGKRKQLKVLMPMTRSIDLRSLTPF
jgi:hypothetical protein